MLCDRCMKNYPVVKITKYGQEYLCDNCIGEELSRFNKNSSSILDHVKKLFKKNK